MNPIPEKGAEGEGIFTDRGGLVKEALVGRSIKPRLKFRRERKSIEVIVLEGIGTIAKRAVKLRVGILDRL